MSIKFFGLNLRFRPLRAQDNASLTTLSHLALILLAVHVRADNQDLRAVPRCLPQLRFWRFGERLLPVLHLLCAVHARVFQPAFEAAAIAYHIRMQSKLRRHRYRRGGFVELPPVTGHTRARRVRDGYSVDAKKRFRTVKLEFRASACHW